MGRIHPPVELSWIDKQAWTRSPLLGVLRLRQTAARHPSPAQPLRAGEKKSHPPSSITLEPTHTHTLTTPRPSPPAARTHHTRRTWKRETRVPWDDASNKRGHSNFQWYRSVCRAHQLVENATLPCHPAEAREGGRGGEGGGSFGPLLLLTSGVLTRSCLTGGWRPAYFFLICFVVGESSSVWF